MSCLSPRLVGLALLCGLLAGCSKSSPPTPAPTAPQPPAKYTPPVTMPLDDARSAPPGGLPTADELVRRLSDFYKARKTLRVETELSLQTKVADMQNAVGAKRTVAFERPNRLAIHTEGEMGGVDIVSDGAKLFTSIPSLKTYTEAAAPASCDQLLAEPVLAMMGGGAGGMVVLALLADDPYARIMEGVKNATYVRQEKLEAGESHHLRFEQEEMNWDLWIAAGADPTVSQVTVDLSSSLGGALQNAGQGDTAGMSITMTETFRNWQFNEPLDAATFAFTPPPDAQRQDNLMAGMGGPEEPSPLVGQPAPPLELPVLDGTTMKLQDHVGKNVVILDFWATWCGPCREEMPVLIEVAKAYADRGVVLYAVNQGEDAETVKKFLEETGLQVTVALDTADASSGPYGVEAIPMLVVIDKQGIVQTVHVGFAPDLKDTLSRELDDLLAGKSLAKPKAEAAPATEAGQPIN